MNKNKNKIDNNNLNIDNKLVKNNMIDRKIQGFIFGGICMVICLGLMFDPKIPQETKNIVIFFPLVGFILFEIYAKADDAAFSEEIKKYCENNNYQFSPKVNGFPVEGLRKDEPDLNNRNHYTNVMSGYKNGISFIVMDYGYVLPRGGSRHYTFCFLRRKIKSFPDFHLRKRNFLGDNLFGFFTWNKINLENDPVFSKKFVLEGRKQEKSIRYFFSTELRKAFIELSEKNYCFEGKKNYFAIYVENKLTLEERMKMLEDGIKIFESF